MLTGIFYLAAAGFIQDNMMDWKSCPPIPPGPGMSQQFGLAGPVAGADGEYVLVAGGANFEDGMPWRGGAKKYHDEIYLLMEKSSGSFSWEVSKMSLPFPIAYPACATGEDGFFSIGGENEAGPVNSVFHFRFRDGVIRMEEMPSLPVAVSSAGAAIADHTLYLVGGLDRSGATSGFYKFRLSRQDAGWERLPSLPVKLSHAVVVAGQDGAETAVYVIGGRKSGGEVSEFYNSVYKYSPTQQKWNKMPGLILNGEAVPLSAGTGFASGGDSIILFGGDRGIYFNQTERMNAKIAAEKNKAKRETMLQEKDRFLTNHPGFSRQILSYNTLTGKCSEVGTIPYESPVTTVAFSWKDCFVIPSGEIRPGVRTGRVILLKMKH